MELKCTGYQINRGVGKFTEIRADLVLPIVWNNAEEMAKALSKIEFLLSGGVSMIQDTGFRCSWCGTKQDATQETCSHCGGAL